MVAWDLQTWVCSKCGSIRQNNLPHRDYLNRMCHGPVTMVRFTPIGQADRDPREAPVVTVVPEG